MRKISFVRSFIERGIYRMFQNLNTREGEGGGGGHLIIIIKLWAPYPCCSMGYVDQAHFLSGNYDILLFE